MKKSFILLVVIFVFLCVFSWQYSYSDSPNFEIEYQVDEFYPPYEYAKDGNIYGFDIELGKLLFNGSPYSVAYSSDIWSNVYKRIKAKEIDLCGLISITEARKKDVLFSDTVVQTHRAIYGKKTIKITSIHDIKNYTIGVQKSDYSESVLVDNLQINNYYTFKNYEDCIVALNSGVVDVIFGNQDVIQYFLVKNQLTEDIVCHLSNLYPANMAYGISTDRPELVDYINSRLFELRKSGAYESIYQKYFHRRSNYYQEAMSKRNFTIIMIIFALTIAFMAASHYIICKLKDAVKRATRDLQKEHEWLSVTLSSIGDAVVATDEKGNISFINPTAQKMTGFKESEMFGKPITELLKIVDNITGEKRQVPVETVMIERKTVELASNSSLVIKDGKTIPISDSAAPIFSKSGEFIGVVMVFRDITEKVEAERALYYQACHDHLTNLPNRRSFVDKLDKSLHSCGLAGKSISVFFIDLDNFKSVNDSLGHGAGDLLLYEIGLRLSKSMEGIGFIARMGGDEFAILIENANDTEELEIIAKNILKQFIEPFIIEGNLLIITPSIGISFYQGTLSTSKDALKLADKAMYKSKEKGKNNYTILVS